MELTRDAQVGERLLIFSNDPEINRITSEVQHRASLLNTLHQAGLSKQDIQTITQSPSTIEEHILKVQLSENKELAKLHRAGIKVGADLPAPLEKLSYQLKAWYTYSMPNRGADKFQNLVYTDSWQPDIERLELEFQMKQLKVYVEGEQLERYRKAEQLCELLKVFDIPWNHLAQSSALSRILEINGHGIKPRWTYFRHE